MKPVMRKIKKVFSSALSHYSSIIMAVLPCIIATPLLLVVQNILTQIPFNGATLVQLYPGTQPLTEFIQNLSNAGIFMLPVYVLWATARHFGSSEPLAIMLGLAFNSSALTSGTEYALTASKGLIEYWELGTMLIPKVGFQGQLFAPLVCGLLMVYLERFLTRKVHKNIAPVINPVIIVAVCYFAMFLLIGPVVHGLESRVFDFIFKIYEEPTAAIAANILFALFMIPIMAVGLHLVLMSVHIVQFFSNIPLTLFPIVVLASFACGRAALADFFIDKREESRALSRQGIIITLGLGNVEPALFGVCMKKISAYIAATVGLTAGTVLLGLFDIKTAQFGVNGIFSLLILDIDMWLRYIISILTTVCVAFGLMFFISKTQKTKKEAGRCQVIRFATEWLAVT